MIDQIAELNRVLLITNSLGDGQQAIERKMVIEECQSISIEGRMPEHSDSIDFAIEIGLLEAKGKKKVLLNRHGLAFINLNPEELFDLTSLQKKFLLRWCFFDGIFKEQTKECLKCFEKSETKNTFTWSATDGQPFGSIIG